jgi:hypothetical protein
MKGSKNKAPQGKHAQPATTQMPTVPNPQPTAAYQPISAGNVPQMNPAMMPQGEGFSTPKSKTPFIVLGVIVLLLAAIYGGGALFFSSHYFPNTNLNNEDVSLRSSDDLASLIQQQAEGYSLTISGQGFTYSFNKGETSISLDSSSIAKDAAKSQDIALWPYECFQKHDISDVVVADYQAGSVDDVIKAQVEEFNKTQDASHNATITYSSATDSFVAKAEVYGTQIDADKLCEKAGECLKEMRTECEVTSDELIKPKILMADSRMLDVVQKANSLFPSSVSLMLNGTVQAATIDKATFGSWLYIDESSYSLGISKDLVTEWVDDKASGMNTVGTTRTWTREDGKLCTVSGGTYGWKVDTDSLADTVYDTLSAGGQTTIEIPCSQTGDTYNGAGARDWGAYVDVDISEQTARYYDASGNLLHSCGVVTGKPVDGRNTPTGVYYLNNKQSPSTLIGYKSNGEVDYETKVTYWMPFVGNSVGLHDASWQSSFGGTRYQTSGSHGCVNLSVSDAAWFYENLSKGVCIITHN